MRIFTEYAEMEKQPCVVAMGMFDGVHIGHRAIIDTAIRIATEQGVSSLVHTFLNHPAALLRGQGPLSLTTPAEKARIIAAAGADALLTPVFTRETARTEPRSFLDVLADETGAAHFVCGENYTFGRAKGGDAQLLYAWAEERGVRVHIVPSVESGGAPVSSTRIRDAVSEARLGDAAVMLGRPFTFSGVVAHGRRIGRTLGLPTANIETDRDHLIPRGGVYAAYIYTGVAYHRAVLNIGVNPTVSDEEGAMLSVEGHLLDYRGVLYSRRVRVMPVKRLRDERRFGSVAELRRQIERDIEKTRTLLAPHSRDIRCYKERRCRTPQ